MKPRTCPPTTGQQDSFITIEVYGSKESNAKNHRRLSGRPVHCLVGCSFSFDDDERHPWYKIEHKHENLIDANEQIKNRVECIPWHWKSDIIPYLWLWLDEDGKTLSPATQRDYENSIKNHLIPWFKKNPYQLHELQYDVLCRLLNDINRSGKGKKNVIYCLRRCLVHAFKSNRIPAMPLFPEEKKYNIVDPIIRWLPEARQIAVINAIPEEHRPIFWWLKFHLRRPSEAAALYRCDYDKEQDAFIIRRTFSAKKLVEHTKTRKQHLIPCHSEFKKIMQRMPIRIDSPYFFVNPHGKLDGKHYAIATMEAIWNTACQKVGEDIDMYSGLKHSSYSQYINEKHYSIDQVQMMTDHARRESVKRYASVQLDEKRRLLEGKGG
jgi:hypothetical protein